MLARLLATIFLFCAAGVAIGFLPNLHRATDTISLLRPGFGLMCLIGLGFSRSILMRLALGIAGLAALLTVAPPFFPQAPGADLRLYSKNILASNTQMSRLAEDIIEAAPDVVMLQEVSTANDGLLRKLRARFPHQHLCRFSGWSGIAVLSRHPFSGPPKCSDWRAVAAAPIMIGGQEVWIVSLHIHWPWPFQSAEAEVAAAGVLTSLQGPTVIAGDFNMLPWTQRVQRIARMTGTRLAGPARFTFSRRNIPLPIDLVLAPGGGQVRMRPLIGSDHAGVVADISLKND